MNAKEYTAKIPEIIRDSMMSFTEEKCYLIPKSYPQYKENRCHLNVIDKIKDNGGHQICGWIKTNNTAFNNADIWVWAFHSIWLDSNGDCYCVTKNNDYNNKSAVAFWKDKRREFCLQEGTAYNNIVVVENDRAAAIMSRASQTKIEAGKLYWTNRNCSAVLELDQHSGIYRILSGYDNNVKMFEDDYGVFRNENGSWSTMDGGDSVSSKMMWDYGVNWT